jgi:hypothetical protein
MPVAIRRIVDKGCPREKSLSRDADMYRTARVKGLHATNLTGGVGSYATEAQASAKLSIRR